MLYDKEIFLPLVSTTTTNTTASLSQKWNNPLTSHTQTPSSMKTVSDTKHVAETFELFFDQHLQNIVQSEKEPEASPYFSYSYSSPSPLTGGEQTSRAYSRFTQTNTSSSSTELSPGPGPQIVEDVLQEDSTTQNYGEEKLDYVEDLTDDELDKISCYIVQESLDAAASNTDMEVKIRFISNYILLF